MFEKFYEDLQLKLDSIATGAPSPIADWKQTSIGGWNGFVKEAERIAGPKWWDKPASPAEQSLAELLKSAGLGELRSQDGREEENRQFQPGGEARGTNVEEVAASQREKEKTKVEDEAEFGEYLPEPSENAWNWADMLAVNVNTDTPEARTWYSALLSYVKKFPRSARAADLDQDTLKRLVENICSKSERKN